MIELCDHLRRHLPPRNTFDAVMRLRGEVYRQHKSRLTMRVEIGGRPYFLKLHLGTGWREILKNLARLRLPVISSEPERRAIRRLQELGVPTVRLAGWGRRGASPASRQSFILTEALAGMVHLDELARDWGGAAGRQRARLQRAVIAEIAAIARALHTHGLNHRDFYLGHFMLPRQDWITTWNGGPVRLHVIDLHRVQMRRATPPRWAIKDISGLLFSSLDAGLTVRDYARFLQAYWNGPPSTWGSRHWRFVRQSVRRAVRLYQSEHGRRPRLPEALRHPGRLGRRASSA